MCLNEKFAFNCGPTLSGIKPSNLFSISKQEAIDYADELDDINELIRDKGLNVVELCRCDKRKLIFVYNAKQISSFLNPTIKEYLHKLNYPNSIHIEDYIQYLIWRLEYLVDQFPHEIGFFLGFPEEDVFGYIYNQGKECQCKGYWKVYGDANFSKCLFDKYERCRYDCLSKLRKGAHIRDIMKIV